MNPHVGEVALAALVIGIFSSILGYLFFVGILSGPGGLMYAGFVMLIGSTAVIAIDLNVSKQTIEDYECYRALFRAPDDDYVIDLTDDDYKWDAPEVTDMAGGKK